MKSEKACGDVDRAIGKLVRVVLSLYPAWLPEAEGIDSPAGAGSAAVTDLARAVAERSSVFGPVLLRLARAALAKQIGRLRATCWAGPAKPESEKAIPFVRTPENSPTQTE